MSWTSQTRGLGEEAELLGREETARLPERGRVAGHPERERIVKVGSREIDSEGYPDRWQSEWELVFGRVLQRHEERIEFCCIQEYWAGRPKMFRAAAFEAEGDTAMVSDMSGTHANVGHLGVDGERRC